MNEKLMLVRTNCGAADRAAARRHAIDASDDVGEREHDREVVVRTTAAAFDAVAAGKIDIKRAGRTMSHTRASACQRERIDADVAARQRIDVGAASASPERQRGRTAIDRHIPNHYVRQTAFESVPNRT